MPSGEIVPLFPELQAEVTAPEKASNFKLPAVPFSLKKVIVPVRPGVGNGVGVEVGKGVGMGVGVAFGDVGLLPQDDEIKKIAIIKRVNEISDFIFTVPHYSFRAFCS